MELACTMQPMPKAATARWMKRAAEVDRAIIAESARWGGFRRDPPFTRDQEWLAEQRRLVENYFPRRTAIVLERTFGGLVAKGIAMWIGFQAFFNMGVNTGLLPTKGLTLPLMSYGGSGILVNCIAIGILLRVDFENRRVMRPAAGGRLGGFA